MWETVVRTGPWASGAWQAWDCIPANAEDGASHNPTAMKTVAQARFIVEFFRFLT